MSNLPGSKGDTDADTGPSTAANTASNTAATPPIEVVAGNPTPAELAAVTAVVHALIEEAGDEPQAENPPPRLWHRSQRQLRGPIVPGPDAWRGFTG